MSEWDDATDLPPVTVVVSTCNRGARVLATIESILANDYPQFSLLVVDQSDTAATEDALRRFHEDRRFRYLRSATEGLGASHNAALSQATTEIIGLTDDDCVVPRDWLTSMVGMFAIDDRVAMVFGNVYPGKHDAKRGYIPVFVRREPFLMKSMGDDLFRGMGIGACMGIKRSAWAAVQRFDTMLGPGAPLGSLEDRDMAIRLLLRGYRVYCAPQWHVVHNGFRTNRQLRGLAFRDWLGFGSVYGKHLKCSWHEPRRCWLVTRYMVGQMWMGQAVRRSLSHTRRRGEIRLVTPVVTFWLGFLLGIIWPVDQRTRRFESQRDRMYPLTARRQVQRFVTANWTAIMRYLMGSRSDH